MPRFLPASSLGFNALGHRLGLRDPIAHPDTTAAGSTTHASQARSRFTPLLSRVPLTRHTERDSRGVHGCSMTCPASCLPASVSVPTCFPSLRDLESVPLLYLLPVISPNGQAVTVPNPADSTLDFLSHPSSGHCKSSSRPSVRLRWRRGTATHLDLAPQLSRQPPPCNCHFPQPILFVGIKLVFLF